MLGLRCCLDFPLAAGSGGCSLVVVHGLLITVASRCRAWALGFRAGFSSHSSQALQHKLNICGAQTQLLHRMWDLSGPVIPGMELVSPALAGGSFNHWATREALCGYPYFLILKNARNCSLVPLSFYLCYYFKGFSSVNLDSIFKKYWIHTLKDELQLAFRILMFNIKGGQTNGISWISGRTVSYWSILKFLHRDILLVQRWTHPHFNVSEIGVQFTIAAVCACLKIITIGYVSPLPFEL